MLIVLLVQGTAFLLLVRRLARGWRRQPPVEPAPEGVSDTTVTVLVATLNEAGRIGPCLAGLQLQGAPLAEVIVVDSNSTDGTQALVERVAAVDPRFRLTSDPPLPENWIGKVWALEHARERATGDWILGVDADTEPLPGMVAGVVRAAREHGYEAVSFSPRFCDMTAGEQWLQPSMLISLIYRTGVPGEHVPPDRVMANGQCFLVRRHLLERSGGYGVARASFADDVTLARHLARSGARVGFLDGSRLLRVRAYSSLGELWREWGRSFDLKDAISRVRLWVDVAFIALVQGAPLLLVTGLLLAGHSPGSGGAGGWLLRLNMVLVVIRVLMLGALSHAYERRSFGWWLSPLSDPVAALRLAISAARRPAAWRGRSYRPASGRSLKV